MKSKYVFLFSLLWILIGVSSCAKVQESLQTRQEYVNTEFHEPIEIENQNFDPAIKAKNIILMVGDGMGFPQVYAARIANGGKLNMTNLQWTGISKTNSSDALITDSAAGATAFATGEKTKNGAIGVTPDDQRLTTILEMAQQKNLSTGLIATCNLTHATPASFAAHRPQRSMTREIAHDMAITAPDIMIGGGFEDFSAEIEGQVTMDILSENGVQVFRNLEDYSVDVAEKAAVFVADDHLDKYLEGRGNYLESAVEKALKKLSQNESGFFIMIEGSQIDWGGHANDLAYVITEALDFDRAIGKALKFAQEDGETLVVITADHETGGMSILGGKFDENKVVAGFNTGGHTGHLVPVFAYGPGCHLFTGQYENTAIYQKMLDAMDWE